MNDAVPQTGAGPAPEQGTGPQASPERDTGAPPAEPRPAPDHHPAGPAPLGVPREDTGAPEVDALLGRLADADHLTTDGQDRKSTRLNPSHVKRSYAVFCLKQKKTG